MLILLFGIIGCGDRPARELKNQPDTIIVGSWQHIFDQEGFNACDPNTDCKCSDVFNFYEGGTFDRNQQCDYKRGSFTFKDTKLQLDYISEYSQIFEYTLNQNELDLVKENTWHKYVRKPFKVRITN